MKYILIGMLVSFFNDYTMENKKRVKTSSDLQQNSNYSNSNSHNDSQFSENDGGDTGYEEDFGKIIYIF